MLHLNIGQASMWSLSNFGKRGINPQYEFLTTTVVYFYENVDQITCSMDLTVQVLPNEIGSLATNSTLTTKTEENSVLITSLTLMIKEEMVVCLLVTI